MNLILRQVIGYQQGLKKASTSASPLLKKQLENTQKDLNSILTKWKFGDAPIKSSEEFLAQFEPWVNKQLEQQKEWKVFLAKHGLHNLAEIKNINTPESESEQLKFFKENIKIKEGIINDYKKDEEIWKNTEQDYLRRIEELQKTRATSEEAETIKQELARKEEEWNLTEADYLARIADQERELKDKVKESQASNGELLKRIEELRNEVTELKATKTSELSETDQEKLAEHDDLITERDEAIREKKTLEQSVLALNNRLNLKQQEVSNKEKTIDQLKKEKGELDKNLNKKLTEKNTLITTLNQEIQEQKKKYSKQGKLLDTEQLEGKKLAEENTKLQNQIKELEKERGKLIQALNDEINKDPGGVLE